jgi:D-sedoheptulose 7-phosphate isomerase
LEAYRQDRLVAVIGNGGSAATASHIVCDLGKTILGSDVEPACRRFRVMAMTDNTPLLTAWANDVDYDSVFAEQVRCWVRPGDLVIAISGSGNSVNICRALQTSREIGATTIGFLGFDGGKAKDLVDVCVHVCSRNYGFVEDIHAIFGHMVTAYIKGELARERLTPAAG